MRRLPACPSQDFAGDLSNRPGSVVRDGEILEGGLVERFSRTSTLSTSFSLPHARLAHPDAVLHQATGAI